MSELPLHTARWHAGQSASKHVTGKPRPKSSRDCLIRAMKDSGLIGAGIQDKKTSQGHPPRVVYHQVFNVY